ncbi:hypothetical protein EPN90_01585 [Patescibacteria group bacterium]|nr:MAG: hypothetical protein EPN90_01585 [Patescibacteria group bacterium]
MNPEAPEPSFPAEKAENEAVAEIACWRFAAAARGSAVFPYLLCVRSEEDPLRLGDSKARGALFLLRFLKETHSVSELAFFDACRAVTGLGRVSAARGEALSFAAKVYLTNLHPEALALLESGLSEFPCESRNRLLAEAERLVEGLRAERHARHDGAKSTGLPETTSVANTLLHFFPPTPRPPSKPKARRTS